jgi:uncharacterized protein (DUF1697 family)
MASVVFLRGVNVGGHKAFRPTLLAQELEHLDPVNIGAAGTLVIRKAIANAALRNEVARRLPFDTQIMILPGREIEKVMRNHPFANEGEDIDVVRFVSVLSRRPRRTPRLPVRIPADGEWPVRILAAEERCVFGVYRRRTRAIGYLGKIDETFGVSATIRNWNTMKRIAGILGDTGLASA